MEHDQQSGHDQVRSGKSKRRRKERTEEGAKRIFLEPVLSGLSLTFPLDLAEEMGSSRPGKLGTTGEAP